MHESANVNFQSVLAQVKPIVIPVGQYFLLAFVVTYMLSLGYELEHQILQHRC